MKKSKKSRYIIIILIIVFAIIAGFYPVIKKRVYKGSFSSKSLKIYVLNNDKYLKKVITEFERKYPGIKIEEVDFNDMNQYKEKQYSEILAGGGPDVIYFNSFYIDSINKLLKTGAFADISSFSNKNLDLKSGDYNQKILNAGVYKGKQYFIPLTYSIPILFSTKDSMKTNNLNLQGELSGKEFFNSLEPLIDSYKDEKDKYIFSDYMGLGDFLESSGVEFINYENKTVDLNKKEITNMLEIYKKLSKHSADAVTVEKYINQQYDMLKANNIAFINNKLITQPQNLMFAYSFTKFLTNQDQVICPLNQYSNGNKLVALAEDCMAINSNTKNKDMALNFISIAMSENIQADDTIVNNIPVNNKALGKIMDENMKKWLGQTINFNNQDFVMLAVPDELKKKYNDILSTIETCKFVDARTEAIMLSCLNDYFQDKRSYEDCRKDAEKKLKLYLNE
jgi:multiple sugar transport system substrate-binding protein